MPNQLHPRESVIFADDFAAMVAWYRDVLGFNVIKRFDSDFHYANLESPSGIRLGIASATEMGVTPGDRRRNTVVLQFQVDDVKALFAHLEQNRGTITNGPSLDRNDNFWFGGFADPEGNPFWVVDRNCP